MHGVFLFAKAELPAVPDAQTIERQDRALSRHAGSNDRGSRPQHGSAAGAAPQDGAEKQDCERNWAKRWLIAYGERVARLRPVYLDDALFSSHPMAGAVPATGADVLFACKWVSHKTLYEYVDGAPLDKHEVTERKPGSRSLTYRYRWIEGVALRDGRDAMNVNWIGVSILDAKGKAA